MKRSLLIILSALLFISGCDKEFPTKQDSYGFKFQFITENYKPLNYQEGTELKGLAPGVEGSGAGELYPTTRQFTVGLNLLF